MSTTVVGGDPSAEGERDVPVVLVVGSANEDFIVRVDRRPVGGETITNARLLTMPGGKGANQAVAAAATGARAVLIASVGDDLAGRATVGALGRRGVDTGLVRADGRHRTGAAFVTVTPDGENSIVVAPGANLALSSSDLQQHVDAFTRASVVLVQGEIDPETTTAALDLAAAHSARTIVNLAPVIPLSPSAWSLVDVLVVNSQEAGAVLGYDVDPARGVEDAARALLVLGARAAVITLGAGGVVYATAESCAHVPAQAADVHDTTGAGDAFVGTMAGRLAQGDGLPEALVTASAVAAASVAQDGAMLPATTATSPPPSF